MPGLKSLRMNRQLEEGKLTKPSVQARIYLNNLSCALDLCIQRARVCVDFGARDGLMVIFLQYLFVKRDLFLLNFSPYTHSCS